MGNQSVLIIPDLHLPFVRLDVFRKLHVIAKDLNPSLIIQIGDVYDFYSFSKYAKSYNLITPKQELDTAHTMAVDMWKSLRKACPKAKLVQMLGNHDARASKRVSERLPEFESLKSWQGLFEFDHVKTIFQTNVEYEFDGVLYTHGWSTKLGDHLQYFNQSVVVGHSHRPGLVFKKKHKHVMFELNAGYIADPTHPVFDYRHSKRSNWVNSLGIITEKGPGVYVLT